MKADKSRLEIAKDWYLQAVDAIPSTVGEGRRYAKAGRRLTSWLTS